MSVVIVGGGQAGTEVAFSLRNGGFAGEITVLSAEPDIPYQRPPLSKDFLKGDGDLEDVVIRPREFYDSKRIDLKLGVHAIGIDRAARKVALSDGGTIGFRHLVLATGAAPIGLDLPGVDAAIPTYLLRDLEHSQALRGVLQNGRGESIVVAGSGFIGLEVAAAAAHYGADVTLLCRADRVMRRSVSEVTSRVFERAHLQNGVDVRFHTEVSSLVPAGRPNLRLTDGSSLEVDRLVVGIGVTPNDELARVSGLSCEGGIVVDAQLRTSDRDIRAIGDCAVSACYGTRQRVESVQNAVDQARFVARQILSEEQGHAESDPFSAVPWFWTQQWGLKLQIAGIIDDSIDDVEVRGDAAVGSYSAFCYSRGKLIAVESVNQPRDHMAARKILESGLDVPSAVAADEAVNLRDLANRGGSVLAA
ncbi:FAD-dependent oxidoreductase [Microbacterium sp. NPDC077644]|uniref:NAD(P)/FAD-dependent oxidoreductase n=1 Tax=Microbacterium sp. NPDC077644 TaxID=3155055 RepID=UPI00344CD64B